MSEIQVEVIYWLWVASASFYAASVVASFVSFKKTGRSEGAAFKWLALTGFILQTSAFVGLAVLTKRLPLTNSYELMAGIAWAIMLINVLSFPFMRAKVAPTFLVLTVCVLAAMPLFCPLLAASLLKESAVVDYASLHAILGVLGYALLGFSFVFSLMYVLQERSLKLKSGVAFSRLLLPLPRLASFSKFFLSMACSLMGLSLIVGAFAALGVEVDGAYVIKFSLGAILFFIMLGLLIFSSRKSFDASAFSKMNVALFAFALLVIIPISIRSFI